MSKAVVLLSGGLDSATALYEAMNGETDRVFALTLDYGQLHRREIDSALKITSFLEIPHQILRFEMPWKGSALLDKNIALPKKRNENEMSAGIPASYVPARNTIFLSLAASYAEAVMAQSIYIGANILDYSGYPDCRPEFLRAFEETIRLGTKTGAEGKTIQIKAPLIQWSKKQIIERGLVLGVPYEWTWSCYQGEKEPCGECDSCILRAKGFKEVGMSDPLIAPQTERRKNARTRI